MILNGALRGAPARRGGEQRSASQGKAFPSKKPQESRHIFSAEVCIILLTLYNLFDILFIECYSECMNEVLKKLRTVHNYSQSYVAEYLNISRQMYIKYENGDVDPSIKVITDLCRLYNVSYSTILGEQEFLLKKSTKTYELHDTENSMEYCVASPAIPYGNKKSFSPLQSKAIKQIKELSDFQIISVLAYIKLLNEEIAENSKERYRKAAAQPVDPIEVERINSVYDTIPKEEQLRFAKAGSKMVGEALKNDTW